MIQLFPVLFLLVFASCQRQDAMVSTSSSSKVEFVKSKTFFSVLDKAEAEGKLVFLDFYSTICVPCKMMDKDVFTDKEIAKMLNKDFISFKVDGEKELGANLRGLYGVYSYPTLLFMDSKGIVLERKVGAAYQTQLKQMARSALDKQYSFAKVN